MSLVNEIKEAAHDWFGGGNYDNWRPTAGQLINGDSDPPDSWMIDDDKLEDFLYRIEAMEEVCRLAMGYHSQAIHNASVTDALKRREAFDAAIDNLKKTHELDHEGWPRDPDQGDER